MTDLTALREAIKARQPEGLAGLGAEYTAGLHRMQRQTEPGEYYASGAPGVLQHVVLSDDGAGYWAGVVEVLERDCYEAEFPDAEVCETLCCGRMWDDAVATGVTPVPAGRTPFEYDCVANGCVDEDADGGAPADQTLVSNVLYEVARAGALDAQTLETAARGWDYPRAAVEQALEALELCGLVAEWWSDSGQVWKITEGGRLLAAVVDTHRVHEGALEGTLTSGPVKCDPRLFVWVLEAVRSYEELWQDGEGYGTKDLSGIWNTMHYLGGTYGHVSAEVFQLVMDDLEAAGLVRRRPVEGPVEWLTTPAGVEALETLQRLQRRGAGVLLGRPYGHRKPGESV